MLYGVHEDIEKEFDLVLKHIERYYAKLESYKDYVVNHLEDYTLSSTLDIHTLRFCRNEAEQDFNLLEDDLTKISNLNIYEKQKKTVMEDIGIGVKAYDFKGLTEDEYNELKDNLQDNERVDCIETPYKSFYYYYKVKDPFILKAPVDIDDDEER